MAKYSCYFIFTILPTPSGVWRVPEEGREEGGDIELIGEEASDGLIDELAVAVCQWEDVATDGSSLSN